MNQKQPINRATTRPRTIGEKARRTLLVVGAGAAIILVGWLVAAVLLGLRTQSVRRLEGGERERPGVEGDANKHAPSLKTTLSQRDGAEMVFIPPGEFIMGTNVGYANEKPEHTVFLERFYIYKFEITVGQYKKFLRDPRGRGHEPDAPYGAHMPNDYFTNPDYDRYPAVNVSWEDADAYCRWAGNRLPTEAEWEKAARGADGRTYPWGTVWDEKKANWDDETDGFRADGHRFTAPVGSFPEGASTYGAHDLAGNVWEWVNDWYQPYQGNVTHDLDYGQLYRVIRGGSWLRYPLGLTCTSRDTCAPTLRYDSIGFRCASNPR